MKGIIAKLALLALLPMACNPEVSRETKPAAPQAPPTAGQKIEAADAELDEIARRDRALLGESYDNDSMAKAARKVGDAEHIDRAVRLEALSREARAILEVDRKRILELTTRIREWRMGKE